jgi:hypothetical protein
MNDKTGGHRGLRDAAALAAAAAVTVLATACGGGSAPPAASTAAAYTQQTFAQCMRGHGVPGFPDPTASGSYTLTASGSLKGAGGSSVDIGSDTVRAASSDCQYLVPNSPSIGQLEQKVRQARQAEARELPQLQKFSQCVGNHGGPNQAAVKACRHLLPPGAHVSVHMSVHATLAVP